MDAPQFSPIEKQATINIGMIGHVANGKSTLVRQLTGTTTGVHSSEKKRNCTISLGYANCKIFQCTGCLKYDHGPSTSTAHPCLECGAQCELVRHVSFVDCPGHDQLISTMINGASVMDGAILVTAANETCPQPQTVEHLMAAELMGVEHYVKVQNKVDLVHDKQQLIQHAAAIEQLTTGTNAHNAPLIPVVAQTGVNMDAVVEAIATCFPIPSHDLKAPLRMSVIRTFKVSVPGLGPAELRGGVLGGSIASGVARVGDLLEIRPGLLRTNDDGSKSVKPLYTRVQSLQCDKALLDYAVPGGLIGIQTDLDPYLCMGDRLVGQVAGAPGTLPPVLSHVAMSYQKLKRVTEDSTSTSLAKGTKVVLHVGAAEVTGVVTKIEKQQPLPVVLLKLCSPVCCDTTGHPVTVFLNKRLVGYGHTVGGKKLVLPEAPSVEALLHAPTLAGPIKKKQQPAPAAANQPEPREEVVAKPASCAPQSNLFADKKKKKKPKPRPEHPDAPTVAPDASCVHHTDPELGSAAEDCVPKKVASKKKKAFAMPEPVEEPCALPAFEALHVDQAMDHQHQDANKDANKLLSSFRFYEKEWPSPQAIVTAFVERTGEHGVHVTLPEYGGVAGFIPLSELTRKNRVRNIKKLAWPGLEMVCCVTSVDLDAGHIDLTKARVTDQEKQDHQERYGEAALAHQVVCRTATLCSPEAPLAALEQIYQSIAWPLAAEHEEHQLFPALLSAAKHGPPASLQCEGAHWEVLMAETRRRMKPRTRKCSAQVRLHCTEPLGVHALRAVLLSVQSDVVSMQIEVPPVYRLSCESEPEVASEELWRSVRVLEAGAARYGCTFQIESSPHIVDGSGESIPLEEPQALECLLSASRDLTCGLIVDSEDAGAVPREQVQAEISWLIEASESETEEPLGAAVCSEADLESQHATYEELLERAIDTEAVRPEKLRLSALQVLMKPKQTLVANFGTICAQIRRPLAHPMLFMTTELGTTASVKGDGCGLVLRGRFKPNNVEVLLRRYINEFVKCTMCGSFNTEMRHDASIRAQVQLCQHCHASHTLNAIHQPTYQAQIGRRKRA